MRKGEETLEETDVSTKRSKKKSEKTTTKKKKSKKFTKEKASKSKKKSKEVEEFEDLEQSYENREDPDECSYYLQAFCDSLKTIDLENLITKENMEYLENINPKENCKIDLILSRIYGKILSSEDFYKDYFADSDENEQKVPLVLSLIEETIQVIDNFSDYFISFDFFKLKENLLKLIKFIYINLKDDITDEEEQYLNKLINELPASFFTQNYLDLIKMKNTIYKNNNELLKNIEDIDNLFFELGSYYEQLSSIKLLFDDIETDE